MKWMLLWCNICNDIWPISEGELNDENCDQELCPGCGSIGVRWQDFRESKQKQLVGA